MAAISAGDYRAAGKTGIQTLLIAVATAITLGEGAAALAGGKGAGTAAIGQAENSALKSTSAAKPNGYSVAFETSIPKSGAGTRGAHFKSANERLTVEIGSNPVSAAAFEVLLPRFRGRFSFVQSPFLFEISRLFDCRFGGQF